MKTFFKTVPKNKKNIKQAKACFICFLIKRINCPSESFIIKSTVQT